MTPETTTKRQASPPLTPQQERMQRAMIARLDALLTKHEGELYADWQHRMRGKKQGLRVEAASLMMVAVLTRIGRRFPGFLVIPGYREEFSHGTSRAARTARRNERLLAGLVLQGCQARGEF